MRKDHPLELLIQPVGVILPVKDENKSRVIKVAAGREHSLALTNDGDIFALGMYCVANTGCGDHLMFVMLLVASK